MAQKTQANGYVLAFMFIVVVLVIIGIIFGFGKNNPSFYSTDKNCLLVEQQDNTYNCYSNHAAYAFEEGLHVDHAKERFSAFRKEAEKREEIKSSVDEGQVFPRENEDYLRKYNKEQINNGN